LRRAFAIAVSVLLAGCSFIDDFGMFTVGDGGSRDGGGSRDAGMLRDGETPPDAGGGTCTAPCVGDIAADFSMTQPSGSLGWQYLADDRDPPGLGFDPMVAGTFEDLSGWIGESAPPAIASCAGSSSARCAGMSDRVLAVPAAPDGTGDAVFSFTATRTETMQFAMTARHADGASSAELVELFVTRNGRHDIAFASSFLPTAAAQDFAGAIDVVQGDRVFFEIRTDPGAAAAAVPIGLAGRVSRLLEGPGSDLENCLFAATFDGGLTDACGGATLVDENDGSGPGMTSVVAGAAPWLGDARMFAEGGYIASTGSPIDYSGDFTIQFWMQFPEPGSFAMTAFSDRTSEAPGGIIVMPEEMSGSDAPMFVGTIYAARPGCDDGMGNCFAYFRANRPTDSAWHFYRVVRSTADNRLRLCIDGREVGGTMVPGEIDLTSTYPPHIGRNVVFNPAYFIGGMDDVRIFKLALPCAP
jgi:hypothetical protein